MKLKLLLFMATMLNFIWAWGANGDTFSVFDSSQELRFAIVSEDDKTCRLEAAFNCSVNVIIPEYVNGYKVIGIGRDAFEDEEDMVSVTLPSSITFIGEDAFKGCIGLTDMYVKMKTLITSNYSIYRHTNITLHVPIGTLELYSNAIVWQNFKEIVEKGYKGDVFTLKTQENVDVAYEVVNEDLLTCKVGYTYVKKNGIRYAINQSTSGTITIPQTVKDLTVSYIADYAFYGCSNLTSVTLPNTIKSIGEAAFYHCSNLESINVPNGVLSIGERSFCGCSKISSINIPQNITTIPQMAFEGCSLLQSVTIPEGVNTIGIRAFRNCSSLTDITIPGSVHNMETWDNCWAFSSCTNLKTITINEGVTLLGWNTFENCNNVEKVIVWNTTPINVYSSFSSFASNATLYVPKGCIDVYQEAIGWNNFKEIKEIKENITMSANGIATYSSKHVLDFTNEPNLKAYIASGFSPSTGELILTRVYKVPVGEGLLLKGNVGNYEIPYTTTDIIYSNLLKGVTSESTLSPTDGSYTNLILANGSHGIGFYTLQTIGNISANKAYLQLFTSDLPSSTPAIKFVFDDDNENFDEDITGISYKKVKDNNVLYNMKGQIVSNPKKGVYILNNKKVIIK